MKNSVRSFDNFRENLELRVAYAFETAKNILKINPSNRGVIVASVAAALPALYAALPDSAYAHAFKYTFTGEDTKQRYEVGTEKEYIGGHIKLEELPAQLVKSFPKEFDSSKYVFFRHDDYEKESAAKEKDGRIGPRWIGVNVETGDSLIPTTEGWKREGRIIYFADDNGNIIYAADVTQPKSAGESGGERAGAAVPREATANDYFNKHMEDAYRRLEGVERGQGEIKDALDDINKRIPPLGAVPAVPLPPAQPDSGEGQYTAPAPSPPAVPPVQPKREVGEPTELDRIRTEFSLLEMAEEERESGDSWLENIKLSLNVDYLTNFDNSQAKQFRLGIEDIAGPVGVYLAIRDSRLSDESKKVSEIEGNSRIDATTKYSDIESSAVVAGMVITLGDNAYLALGFGKNKREWNGNSEGT